jgi:hypothetical protein
MRVLGCSDGFGCTSLSSNGNTREGMRWMGGPEVRTSIPSMAPKSSFAIP